VDAHQREDGEVREEPQRLAGQRRVGELLGERRRDQRAAGAQPDGQQPAAQRR